MATILRVKRKNTDVPLDTLVIACKRPKTEVSRSDTLTLETVAQFAGTLTDPTEDVTKHVAKILPKIKAENYQAGVKRPFDYDYPANVSGKIPKWTDEDSTTERYKVIDCQHSLDTSNEEELKDKWVTLVEVEDCWSISRLTSHTEADIADYVYDIYYAQTSDDVFDMFDSNNILVKRPEYDSDVGVEDEDNSSDSNAESHWKNDYPDTDPDRSSRDDDSDDNFDIYNDDHKLYYSTQHGFSYGRRQELESHSDSDLSNTESNSSDNEERLSNEKISDIEEISDNEGVKDI
ncbi:uncharacterized protein Fs(2)ltopp43 [Temnothorax nylanderi]|uniref:uncharacterized protein Fs(2)ltopp43 n=1 Tax=Temnothorax nylanderi TaxID=102681 RepID=UPI003A87B705